MNNKLAIKLNTNPVSEPCPLCGQETNPNIGVELMLADSNVVVCRDCGRKHAPTLYALLTLAFFAADFYLSERDFGDMWQASRENPDKRGLDWNVDFPETDAA